MKDERTSHLSLPLPHVDNQLHEDVGRIRESFKAVDANAKEKQGTLDGEIKARQDADKAEAKARQDLKKELDKAIADSKTPAADHIKETGDVHEMPTAGTTVRGIARVATTEEVANKKTEGEDPAFVRPEDLPEAAEIPEIAIATAEKRGIARIATPEEILNGITGENGPAFLAIEQVMQLLRAIKPLWPIGWMERLPFRNSELPDGWYFMNGDRYTLSSPQGQALFGLPQNYKNDWGITVSSDTINVPKFFYVDGRGYFIRAVNGTNRQVGSHELDAMQNVVGSYNTGYPDGSWPHPGEGTGPFVPISTTAPYAEALYSRHGVYGFTFDLSRSARTSSETRVLDIGMTPAIYLGV